VWQWAVDSGKEAIDSTSRLLKRLEVPGLKLENDGPETQAPGGPPKKAERLVGYNPYGAAGSAGPARPEPASAARAASVAASKPAAAIKPAAETAMRPSLWQRLFRKQ
jgi:hypothetical protein